MLKIELENNAKHGAGYQVRVNCLPPESTEGFVRVINEQPYTMNEAYRVARQVTDSINKKYGTDYSVEEVTELSDDAVRDNASRDDMSARVWERLKREA